MEEPRRESENSCRLGTRVLEGETGELDIRLSWRGSRPADTMFSNDAIIHVKIPKDKNSKL